MNNSNRDPRSPSPSFAGASAFLLLAIAFCAYLIEAHESALLFAAVAFLSFSLTAPGQTSARVRARSRDVETGREC